MATEELSRIPDLARQWMAAWIAQDRAALDAFLAPGYVLVGAAFAGRAIGRGDWLDTAVGPYKGSECDFADPVLRQVSADVAVMTAQWTQIARNGDHDLSGRYWITDLWHRGGVHGWQVALRSSVALDTLDASSRAFAGFR